jgi:hypothetical protein
MSLEFGLNVKSAANFADATGHAKVAFCLLSLPPESTATLVLQP